MKIFCPMDHEASDLEISFEENGTLKHILECKFCKITYEIDVYGTTSPRLIKKEWSREKKQKNEAIAPATPENQEATTPWGAAINQRKEEKGK